MPYLMEDPREGDRVLKKTDPRVARRQMTEAGLRPGMRALDAGCSSGAVLREMARLADPGMVTGLDSSRERVEMSQLLDREAGLSNIDYLVGDVTGIPLPDDSFDFIWSRFVLEYLPEPWEALAEFRRLIRPGGRVVAADIDGYCSFNYPMDDYLAQKLEGALEEIHSLTGFDAFVGRKLYSYFRKAGYQDIRVNLEPYHMIFGKPEPETMALWETKLDILASNMGKLAGGKSREWAHLKAAYLDYLARPDTSTYSVLFIVSGTK